MAGKKRERMRDLIRKQVNKVRLIREDRLYRETAQVGGGVSHSRQWPVEGGGGGGAQRRRRKRRRPRRMRMRRRKGSNNSSGGGGEGRSARHGLASDVHSLA